MDNLEIDRKLAEAMGYKDVAVRGTSASGEYVYYRDMKENVLYKFNPTEDMGQAWEVAERFGLKAIMICRSTDGLWEAWFGKTHASDKSAPLAICKAVLKVIEGSESDE